MAVILGIVELVSVDGTNLSTIFVSSYTLEALKTLLECIRCDLDHLNVRQRTTSRKDY